MPENEERFATKEEILKGLKKQYNNHRISYKEYMLQVKKTEKYYDKWLAEYEERKNGPKIDTTNEELAIGKKMDELQNKVKPIQEEKESEEIAFEEVPNEITSITEEKTEE